MQVAQGLSHSIFVLMLAVHAFGEHEVPCYQSVPDASRHRGSDVRTGALLHQTTIQTQFIPYSAISPGVMGKDCLVRVTAPTFKMQVLPDGGVMGLLIGCCRAKTNSLPLCRVVLLLTAWLRYSAMYETRTTF